MPQLLRTVVLCVALGGGAPAGAAALADALRHHATAERLDLALIATLYDEAIVTDGGVDRTLERLRAFAAREGRPPRQLANTRLVIGHLLWRHGDQAAALTATDQALALRETADGLLLKARLLDAKGDAEGAADWYQRAAAASDREEEREFIRLRLTMAQASERNVDALLDLAGERDTAFSNRAAVALAILGHPDKALATYHAGADFGAPFRQHIRLAEWAIAAADWKRAQAEAWRGFDAAGPRADRLYALAILAEAHRGNDALGGLLAAIDQRMTTNAADADNARRNQDLARLRVDLLIETQRYDEAIAFYQTADDSVDIAARRRLVQLYEAAGRRDDMVVEYRRLLRAEPHTVAWYSGLAGHYMNMADEEQALGVWATLEAQNGDRPGVLLEAGQRMIEMGFVEPAVAMVERHMANAGESAPALLFLFEARFERGRNEEALAALERLEAAIPPGDGAVRDLADAYERLNQPQRAVRLLEALRDVEGGLGYDERMRLAWLYSVADRKADALAAWRELWLDVKSAARRALAEDQLMLLAAERNELADVVVELEDKLHLGQANRNEMNLLVRIYTQVGDSLSATEIIEEYALQTGSGEAERLRRLGQVYRMVADYDAYDGVLRQLVAVDTENELEHVQNIVLNMLAHDLAEDSDERFGEITRWLGKLREFDERSVSGEFEAGILSMGGFADEAIESYRRALVEQPENSDNLLLMADLMKNAGRRDEAVALLQYAAEHAADDNAFVVAVDGIINMIGARSFTEQLTPAMRDIFRWTHRVILERVTGRDDKFYLYRLLADIAQEIGDTEGEFLALENSLSQAGLRRPAVLRELVTLATPNTGFGGFDTGGGDAHRHLVHGRRLIGLRQALPPDVYIDLAGVLLDRGDLAGAGQAFDRIDDITGLIDVNKTKADLLHEAGHPAEALVHYNQALNVNRDDLALLARTAMLREVQGQDDVANRLYWRALAVVLRAQAVTKPPVRPGADRSPMAMYGMVGPDTSVTREYRTYFETLAQGFLITWPQDAEAARERLQAVYALIDAAAEALPEDAAAADEDDKPDLAEFPRLHRATEFAGRLAERIGGELGAALDAHVEATLAGFQVGDPAAVAEGQEVPLLRRQLALAKKRDNFGLVVRLAKLLGDEATLEERFRARIAAGKVREGLTYAWHLLSPAAFERLARSVLPTLADHEAGLLELIGQSTDLALQMEERLGVDLVPTDALPALLTGRAAQAQANSPMSYLVPRGLWRYAQAKLDVGGQVALLERLAGGAANPRLEGQLSEMFTDLVAQPLTTEQQVAVADAANAWLGKMDDTTSEFGRRRVMSLLLEAAPAAENRNVVYGLAASWQRRTSLPVDVVAALTDLHEGTPAAGFDALLRFAKADLWRGGYYGGERTELRTRFAAERERFFDRLRAGEAVDADVAALVYEMEFPPFEAPTRERAALLRDLTAAFPEDPRFHDDLVEALLTLGERDAAEEALVAFAAQDARAEFPRAALYFHYLGEGRYDAALAVATDGGPDLRDPAVVEELVRKAGAAGFRPGGGSGVGIFRRVYPKPIDNRFGRWPKNLERGIEQLRELAKATPTAADDDAVAPATPAEELPKVLRAVWRGAMLPGDESSPSYREPSSTRLLSMPLAAGADGFSAFIYVPGRQTASVEQLLDAGPEGDALLFDALAELPGTAAELERYSRALKPQEQRQAESLYQLVASALAAAQASEHRERELTAALRQGRIGSYDFLLWMVLRDNQDAPLPADLHEAFAARFARIDEPTTLELLLAARLHAKGNAGEAAAAHYRAVAAQLYQHDEFDERRFFVIGAETGRDCASLLAEVAERLPAAAPELAREMLAVFRPLVAHTTTDAYFHALVQKGFGAVLPAQQALAAAAAMLPDAPPLAAPLKPHDMARAIELVRLQAKAGATEEALATLRILLAPAQADTRDDEMNRPYAAHMLPRLYGVSPGSPALALLGPDRERVFPSTSHPPPPQQAATSPPPPPQQAASSPPPPPQEAADAWPGAQQWTHTAAKAMLGWFDEAEDETARARIAAAVWVAAWQLQQAGKADEAREVAATLADKAANGAAGPAIVRDIALLTLRLGQPLPRAMAEQAIAAGALTASQEVAVVQALADAGETGTALAVGRLADTGNKAELLRVLRPLAEAADDQPYATDLVERLADAEAARERLGVDPTS